MSNSIYVFDTNSVVSALLIPRSVSQLALAKAIDGGQLAQSLATMDELRQVLERPKFDKYVTREERIRFFTALTRTARLVETDVTITACRDPKDNKFLELAVSAQAQAIVSGDDDLLTLHPFQSIPILTPRAFLDQT
ncbi:MAG: putative toxin-antitoxin system toxin component, PIN family [Anaerolineaceae bacterium]|nr:putative toxin-antitoxin system toxin component, PIN family [Anaerolineaceae bacterium]